jgi:hypothetical protein
LEPSLINVKISPSVEPCFQLASVRSEGLGGFIIAAILPSPLPVAPWQEEHWVSYSVFPAAIDAGTGLTGFFNFIASACSCAPAARGVDGCA